MINHKNKTDDFFKDFIQKADIESPSQDFTRNVMQKINTPVPESSLIQNLIKTVKNWYFIAIVAMVGTGYSLFYLMSSNFKLITGDIDPFLLPMFKQVIHSFSGLFKSIEISSFTIVVILSIAALFIIDKVLTKFKTGKQTYFSF